MKVGIILVFTEEQLKNYAKPLSKTEEEKCKHAINLVINALSCLGFKEDEEISRMISDTPSYMTTMSNTDKSYKIRIFLQGSYANNTNVRSYSDVDIAVIQEDAFRGKYRNGLQGIDYGFFPERHRNKSFKDIVQEALVKSFGKDVKRKNKSIKIYGNTYRNDADTVPAIRYRDYSKDYKLDKNNYVAGILIKTDDGSEIINYPEQHLRNGVEKNKNTNYYFKKMVRIGKELRYQMEEEGFYYANLCSSFGVECLLYNVPDHLFFVHDKYSYIFDGIVKYLYNNKIYFSDYFEINGIKKLNCDSYDRSEVYMKFIDELREFYQYEI